MKGQMPTFSIEWEIYLDNAPIESKNGVKMRLDYVAREIGDYDNFGVVAFRVSDVHVNVGILSSGGP